MKDGIRLGKDTKREMGNEIKKLIEADRSISQEDAEAFFSRVFDDVVRESLGNK